MEGWQVSLIIAVVGVIGTFAVNRYVTNENTKRIADIIKKVDEHSETLSQHKVEVANAVTMAQVDEKFITRDLFKAHEKHIDQRFRSLEKKLDDGFSELKQILKEL